MNKALEKPTAENLAQLKDLYEIQKRVNDMSEWPFNWKALWQLMTAVFVPVIAAVCSGRVEVVKCMLV